MARLDYGMRGGAWGVRATKDGYRAATDGHRSTQIGRRVGARVQFMFADPVEAGQDEGIIPEHTFYFKGVEEREPRRREGRKEGRGFIEPPGTQRARRGEGEGEPRRANGNVRANYA